MRERLDRVEDGVGRRDAATSFLGGWAVAPIVQVTTAPAIVDRDLVPVRADDVHLRAHPGGWFDGIALGGAGQVTRGADLEAQWARQAAEVLTPVLAAVHEAGERFGLRGLWGNAVVDRVLWTATDLAERGFGDARTLVRRAQDLLDALEAARAGAAHARAHDGRRGPVGPGDVPREERVLPALQDDPAAAAHRRPVLHRLPDHPRRGQIGRAGAPTWQARTAARASDRPTACPARGPG